MYAHYFCLSLVQTGDLKYISYFTSIFFHYCHWSNDLQYNDVLLNSKRRFTIQFKCWIFWLICKQSFYPFAAWSCIYCMPAAHISTNTSILCITTMCTSLSTLLERFLRSSPICFYFISQTGVCTSTSRTGDELVLEGFRLFRLSICPSE